jgi:hypothetical protein
MTRSGPRLPTLFMGDDPYLWLEAVAGEQALDWVERHNGPTLARLSGDRFEQMRVEALDVLDADTRIPPAQRYGEYLYNFWRDASRPRGVWRHTTLEEYREDSPEWDVLIDVDALAATPGDDVAWLWTDGTPMTQDTWNSGSLAFAVWLNGSALTDTDAQGTVLTDDTFLILFNASWNPQVFTLPPSS